MIIICLMAGIALALACPDTPIGRFVRRHLVERPALWLNDAKPVQVAMTLLVICALLALIPLFPPADLLPMIGEAPFYADLCLLVVAAVSGSALKAVKGLIGQVRLMFKRRAPRMARRQIRARRSRPLRKSDDDHPVWVWA